MEHSEALETNASDRYLLGELSAAEADAFEEHYFDCAECAEDVRLGMRFLEAGRRLVRETPEPAAAPAPAAAPVVSIDSHPRRRGLRWIPAAAVAAILAIPVNVALLMRMQSAVPAVPRLGAMASIEDVHFTGPTRSKDDPVRTIELPKGLTLPLAVDVSPKRPYPRYEARILRGDDVLSTYYVAPAQLQDPVRIPLPDPGPGTYDLVIVGIGPAGETEEIVRHRFKVTR